MLNDRCAEVYPYWRWAGALGVALATLAGCQTADHGTAAGLPSHAEVGRLLGVSKCQVFRKPLDKTKLQSLGEPLRPYRSYATWYLWRSLDGPVVPGLKT